MQNKGSNPTGSRRIPQIRPVSDLRNSFAEISRTVHETRESVILTKNGYGDMVVMSMRNIKASSMKWV